MKTSELNGPALDWAVSGSVIFFATNVSPLIRSEVLPMDNIITWFDRNLNLWCAARHDDAGNQIDDIGLGPTKQAAIDDLDAALINEQTPQERTCW